MKPEIEEIQEKKKEVRELLKILSEKGYKDREIAEILNYKHRQIVSLLRQEDLSITLPRITKYKTLLDNFISNGFSRETKN